MFYDAENLLPCDLQYISSHSYSRMVCCILTNIISLQYIVLSWTRKVLDRYMEVYPELGFMVFKCVRAKFFCN